MIPASTLCRLALHNADSSLSIRSLIAAGEIAGHNENAVRVACARLKQQGLIQTPSRGVYALTARAGLLDDFAKRWMLGEERKRPHQSDFLTAFFDESITRQERNLRIRALTLLGFVNTHRTWVRPNNLTLSDDKIALIANQAFSTDRATSDKTWVYFAHSQPRTPLAQLWRSAFDCEALLFRYRVLIDSIQRTESTPQTKTQKHAQLLDATLLGERAIQTLANDPLLPEIWLPSTERVQLFKLTKALVKKTRAQWQQAVPGLSMNTESSSSAPQTHAHSTKKKSPSLSEGAL